MLFKDADVALPIELKVEGQDISIQRAEPGRG
jgi:hypothetical protein